VKRRRLKSNTNLTHYLMRSLARIHLEMKIKKRMEIKRRKRRRLVKKNSKKKETEMMKKKMLMKNNQVSIWMIICCDLGMKLNDWIIYKLNFKLFLCFMSS
jgi:hypothetical protein